MYIRQRQIFVGIITMMIIVMMMVGDDIIMEIVGCWQCNESKIRYSYGKTLFVAIFLISYLIDYS